MTMVVTTLVSVGRTFGSLTVTVANEARASVEFFQ